jgi:hypothetical protein
VGPGWGSGHGGEGGHALQRHTAGLWYPPIYGSKEATQLPLRTDFIFSLHHVPFWLGRTPLTLTLLFGHYFALWRQIFPKSRAEKHPANNTS